MIIPITLPTNAPLQAVMQRDAIAIEATDAEWCGRVASDIARSRSLQRRLLAGFHMADPVWDMLLDLYLSERKGVRVSISDLALAAGVPRSTGVRWVGNLIETGRLSCQPDAQDGRRTWVVLSAASRAALEHYFLEVARPLAVRQVTTACRPTVEIVSS
jgi:DNA-binding MarR family transcriptional regulator